MLLWKYNGIKIFPKYNSIEGVVVHFRNETITSLMFYRRNNNREIKIEI